jgi:hypothetical protein
MSDQQAKLGGGIVLVAVSAACVGGLIYLLIPPRRKTTPPPIPSNVPAPPPGTVSDATAFSSDNPFGIKNTADYVCRTPSEASGAAAAAAAAPAAPAAFVSTSTCPGEADSPGPAFGTAGKCPQPPQPPPLGPPGKGPATHAFADSGYGYCTGVPGTADSTLYRDWVKFYDDPAKTGDTFARKADVDYTRVGNVTGAGCFVSPDSGKTNANFSRSPFMQTMMVGDEAVLYDMLTRAYPCGPGLRPGGPKQAEGFPRLTPKPKPMSQAPTFGDCVAHTTPGDKGRCNPAAAACPGQTLCQDKGPGAKGAAQCKCTCNPPCGNPGVCANPPCPAINCNDNCQVTATVSATKLGTATFAVDGGYGDHFLAVHKIWGFTPKYEMGGVIAGNVYPFKPSNRQGDNGVADGGDEIQPGDAMYDCHVLRHRMSGDFATQLDPNADRDGLLPPGVDNALDFHNSWVRPKGYEAASDDVYQAARATCGECTAGGKACFSELGCKVFKVLDETKPLSIVYDGDDRPDLKGKTIQTFYKTPPQLPLRTSDNPTTPSTKASPTGRQSYSSPGALELSGANPRARAGACSATKQVFGPGRYTARAKVKPTRPQSPRLLDMTDPSNPRGRGFVFAMWTFAYAEVYAIGSNPETNPGFVVSDQATTSAPCWDDCSCLTNDANFCKKPPQGVDPNTCCDPRVARIASADSCTSPQAFLKSEAGTAALYKDPNAGEITGNVLSAAKCDLSPYTADPHTEQQFATEGGCYIANEDIDCWVGDPDNQNETTDKDNCGVTFCSNQRNPRAPDVAGKETKNGNAWLNAGPCLKAVNTFEGGRAQPNAVNAVSKDWDLKINGKRPPYAPYTTVCSGFKVYTSINSEIDIEIPANSPQLDWTKNLNFNTMNANTWAFDIDSYQGYKPYYSQAMVQPLPKQMPRPDDAPGGDLPTVQPTFVDDRYHDYAIDWYVDQDHSKSYVAFYFDGELIYSTQRFVPTRSGRLIWGLWPGWWGTGRQVPDYSFGYADLAAMIIEPYTQVNAPDVKVRTMPQTYDQVLPADVEQTQCCPFSQSEYEYKGDTECKTSTPCELACDFQPIPMSLQPAAKRPTRSYGCVDGICRGLDNGKYTVAAGNPTYSGDPYCGGVCGTCVGCIKTAPPPDPNPHRDDFKFTGKVLLYLGACVGLVVGALLLASYRRPQHSGRRI